MTWRDLIAEATRLLQSADIPSAAVDARLIGEYVQGSRHNEEASTEDAERFRVLIARRCAREPLQHITGAMYFRYLELVSRAGAFIVRPETEMVAEAAIEEARRVASGAGSADVLDLCTGSGAIAIAVATEVPGSRVVAVEKSAAAFEVACENNERYGGLVTLVHADALGFDSGRYDIVVSNPPYVPPTHELSPEVLADPAEALWGGGPDGLVIPEAIIARAFALLRPGGLLVMEHAEEQSGPLRSSASAVGFIEVSTGHDMAGRERYLRARRVPLNNEPPPSHASARMEV